MSNRIDLNDPETLRFYNQLLVFKEDASREALIFPASLAPNQRRIVHTLAHHMQLGHSSRGNGEQRQVHVFRANNRPSPPMNQLASIRDIDAKGRGLNRAATIDFNEARNPETGNYNVPLRGQQSSGLLGIPDSPGGFGTNQNLRAAKSVADLRSFTPSPVPSSNSFTQQHLAKNISRYQDYGPGSGSAGTPTLPNAPNGAFAQRADEGLVNGFGNMSLKGNTNGHSAESPLRLRSMFSWDHDNQVITTTGPSAAGAIGSNRTVSLNANYDNNANRDRGVPLRQPHGPSDRGASGFARRPAGHQQRGSDELRSSSNVEIIVE